MNKKVLIAVSAFVLILYFFCATFYRNIIFELPSLFHAWAQADRMALAVCYYDNGMNFFKPATLAQFSKEGVVGVEFPIQAYMAAAIAKLFGRNHISFIFRLETTIISCIGLLFLFLAAYKRTKDFILSLVAPLFIFCSPIFIYYTCNYLPDTAGTSMAFIGFYFVLNYLEQRKTKDFIGAAIFLSLGTLIKTTILSYLAGFYCIVLFQKITERDFLITRANVKILVTVMLSLAVLIGNYLFIQYLNKAYDSSLFMSAANPFKDWEAFRKYTDDYFKNRWMHEYFVLPQYLMMAAIVAPGIYLLKRNTKWHLWLLLLYFVLASIVFYLMGAQFDVHDYYIIPIFFPLIAFAILTSMIEIGRNVQTGSAKIPLRISLVASLCIVFFFADFHSYRRFSPDYEPYKTLYRTTWMENGDKFLTELGLPKDAPIVVLEENAPNLPLIYFDRKGHVLGRDRWWKSKQYLEEYMSQHGVQWMIIESENQKALLAEDETIFSLFHHVATRDRIVVYKRRQ